MRFLCETFENRTMDIKTQFQIILTEMTQIISPRQDRQNVSESSTVHLVGENGLVNEEARSRLAFLVNDLQTLTGSLGNNQQPGKYQEGSMSTVSTFGQENADVSMKCRNTDVANVGRSDQSYFASFPLFGSRSQKMVQMLIPVQTPTTKDFSTAITSLCKDISYKCIMCYTIGELCDKYPLAVICPVSSRLEPDVDLALNEIRWKGPFVVLLLHSGLESSLPRLPSASKLANRDKYKSIEFIDIAYTMEAKLYKCQMNESARLQLQTFFARFYKK